MTDNVPTNEKNSNVSIGIENLLSASSITEDDYQLTESRKLNGDFVSIRSLRKTELCRRMCEQGNSDDFASFSPALDTIEAFLDTLAPNSADEADPGAANVRMGAGIR